jgi:uncharacterized protein (DUF433 family)
MPIGGHRGSIYPESIMAAEPDAKALLARITHDPQVMGGRPCIRGMRVTVGTIVGLLAAGRSMEEILDAYPYLEREDIQAALAYAAWRSEEIDLPLKAS